MRLVVKVVAAALVGTVTLGCASESDDARSGDGPAANPTSTTSGGARADEEEATTTEAPVAPSTSPMLTVVGNVTVPDGELGRLTVVLVGPIDDGGSVPVVVRNRTDDTLYAIDASGTARGSDSALVGSGSSQGFSPSTVRPGEWAFGYVYFSGEIPPGATFDITATGETDDNFIGSLDVRPVETNVVPAQYGGNQVVGIVENPHDEPVQGPVSVDIICFDAAGTGVASTHRSYSDSDTVAEGGTASFSVDLFDTECTNYVVGASGHNF